MRFYDKQLSRNIFKDNSRKWRMEDDAFNECVAKLGGGLTIYEDNQVWKYDESRHCSARISTTSDHFLDPLYPTSEELVLWELEFGDEYPEDLVRKLHGIGTFRDNIRKYLQRLKSKCKLIKN